MRTQMATKEYANRVPMDMRLTRAARSNRKAIRAGRRTFTLLHISVKSDRGTKSYFSGSD